MLQLKNTKYYQIHKLKFNLFYSLFIFNLQKEHQKQQEMYINITNEFEVQRKSNESETIRKCVEDGLEETQQQFQNQQQQQQQYSLQSGSNNIDIGAQLKSENNLQL